MRKCIKKLVAVFSAVAILSSLTSFSSDAAVTGAQAIAKGVDVSKYQGAINWAAVASQGYSFAFVKIGSAKSGLDPAFVPNMIGASAAGLRTGGYIYSYANTVEGAIAEANFAVQALQNMPVSFPIAFDIEDNVQKGLNPAQQQALVNAFCSVLESEGYYPMVYASKNWFLTRLGPTMYDHWVAQYADACDAPMAFAVWQASSQGAVPGIAGRVDIDYLYKDYSAEIIPYGWVNRKGFNYFYENWHMKRGWIQFADAVWYTDELGHMVTGWQDLNGDGTKRYFLPVGPMAIGIVPVDGVTYYFGPDGIMQTGWQTIAGFKYLLADNGAMQFGWYQAPEGKYYFAETGAMATGWVPLGDKNYHFDEATGILSQSTFVDTAGLKYYVDADGAMVHGFQNIGGSMYYFAPDGSMQVGFLPIDGKNYYFDPSTGVMAANSLVPLNGLTFYAGADGSMQTGWQDIGGALYYFQEDGSMAQNIALDIDGVSYVFDPNGVGVPVVLPDPAALAALAAMQ